MNKTRFILFQFFLAIVLLTALLRSTNLTLPVNAAAAAQPISVFSQPEALASIAGLNFAQDNAIVVWDSVALQAIRLARPGPPVVARSLAMVHTAMYEAWSQYDATSVGTLLGATFRQPVAERSDANKTQAISYAAYRVLLDLFPDYSWLFGYVMDNYHFDPNITIINGSQPVGIGNLAAAVVLSYRHDDGANQLGDRHPGAYSDYTGYKPVNPPDHVNDLNHWQPLRTYNGSFQGGCLPGVGDLVTQTHVAPHWGNVFPFALNDGPVITPTEGPIQYPSPEFTLQAQEVLSLSAHLTDRQKAITEYWADGPASELPPGHWALIAQYVSVRDENTLDEDAKLFLALTNANLDAGILAWKLKRIHDSVRPITAIRELFRGQSVLSWAEPFSGTQLIQGETWQPYQQLCFVTPAFAEFVSGHSTFSAASAEVLKSFTGSDAFGNSVIIPPGSSQVEPGEVPTHSIFLKWDTFSQAADEAGMSRRYGGIHFERGDLVGRALGRQVGARAWQKSLTFFDGTATPVANLQSTIARLLEVGDFMRVFYPHRFYLPFVAGMAEPRLETPMPVPVSH